MVRKDMTGKMREEGRGGKVKRRRERRKRKGKG